MLLKITLLTLFIVLSCLKLSHAQTNLNTTAVIIDPKSGLPTAQIQAPVNQLILPSSSVPTPAPAVISAPPAATLPAGNTPLGTTAPGGSTSTVNPPDVNINTNNLLNPSPAEGKYSEYQSICRTREFDDILFKSTEEISAYKENLKNDLNNILKTEIKKILPVHFDLLRSYLKVNDKEGYESFHNQLKDKILTEQEKLRLNAFNFFSKKNYSEARKALLKALNGDEKNESILTFLAEIYQIENNFYESNAIYEDLNKFTKNKYLPELCESTVLNSLNAEGEKICMQAARKFRQNPFPLIYAGISNRERLENKRATAYFKLSQKIKPTEMSHICLAEMALIDKDIASAIVLFKESTAFAPRSVRTWLGLASAQMQARQYEPALDSLQKACALNRRFEIEVRKAYKKLIEDKIPIADKYMKLAQTCGS